MNGFHQRILIALNAIAFTLGVQAADCVLRVDGIDGESSVPGFERWIDVTSFDFGSVQDGISISSPVRFRHAVDRSTPKFQEACMKGMRIGSGELHARYADDIEFVAKFTSLKIARADVSAAREGVGDGRPVEDVCLSVDKIEYSINVYWTFGNGASLVSARWQDGELTLDGSGEAGDFAQAGDVPWAGLSITNVVIGSDVQPKKNLFLGLEPSTLVNGTIPLSLLRRLSGDQLTRKCESGAAAAIHVENGRIRLRVATEVAAQLGLNEWTPIKVEDVQKCDDGRIRLVIPLTKPQGFYRMKSK